MSDTQVIKRNGTKEPFMEEKIHKVVTWAAEGLKHVSVSQVVMAAKLQIQNGTVTADIHEALIKAAVGLISEKAPDYQHLAGRLKAFSIRKRAYGRFKPFSLKELVFRNVANGRYDHTLLEDYTEEDLDRLEKLIDHDRDLDYVWAGQAQLNDKYLVQDRDTGEIFESPQMLYFLVAATLFSKYPEPLRTEKIKTLYDKTSLGYASLPTPIMAGVRTSLRQFSSCVVIEADDSIRGIGAATTAIMIYVAQRAGIGLNFGAIRAKGSRIRDGSTVHTGVTQFLKVFEAATLSCAQGGIRKGSATAYYPFYHLDAEDFLVLKNNRGTEENRVRGLDYAIQWNKLIFERMTSSDPAKKHITLFSPADVTKLNELFFSDDYAGFKAEYERLEALGDEIRHKRVNALKFMTTYIGERAQTGRYYWQDAFHTNAHMPFDPDHAPVRQSNLCLEIALPTKPLKRNVDDEDAEIALCTLAATNWLKIQTEEEMEEVCSILVEALDILLSYQDYPLAAAERSVKKYRPLGVGIINYAADLAWHGYKYGERGALNHTHRKMEMMQYYLMKASVDLARRLGPCEGHQNLRYWTRDELCIDTYCKRVDELHDETLHMDWDKLREDMRQYGLRNATLSALMPSETSSQVAGATNGIEPPRAYVSGKASKSGVLSLVVPNAETHLDKYTYAWDMTSNDGYIDTCAVLQKFTCQTISANFYYNPFLYPGEMVPVKVIMKDLIRCQKYGVKTGYYHNTRPKGVDKFTIDEGEKDDGCGSGGCKI